MTVTVNDTEVTDDSTYAAAATPGAAVSVRVRVIYSNVSWLPAGASLFLRSNQGLSETAVLCREG